MRRKGKIASWNDAKGFGFIAPYDDGAQIFLHIKALGNRSRRPAAGDVVTYAVERDKAGRLRAANATLAGDKPVPKAEGRPNSAAIVFALLFLGVASISVLFARLPLVVLAAYFVVSFISVLAYAMDKSAARHGDWRTSEGTLHLLALCGGWPGALIAQETLRHKSKKTEFRVVFWATVFINIAAFIWLHTAQGRSYLDLAVAADPASIIDSSHVVARGGLIGDADWMHEG